MRNSCKRIDFVNKIRKERTSEKEALYYSFPFAIKNFTIRGELPNAVLVPGIDQLSGSHTDFYAVRNWVDISGDNYGITWATKEASIVEFGEIRTYKWEGISYKPKRSHIYSYLMHNTWNTNCPLWQGGDYTFHFSLMSYKGGYNGSRAAHFGWGFSNSFIAQHCLRQKGKLPENFFSFCQVDKSNIIILMLKKAENRNGYIIRLFETEGKSSIAKVKFAFKMVGAYLTDLVENNIRALEIKGDTINVFIKKYEIFTIRVILKEGGGDSYV